MRNPLLDRLLHYFRLIEAGCPVGRDELSDDEWLLLGQVRTEWKGLVREQADKDRRESDGR